MKISAAKIIGATILAAILPAAHAATTTRAQAAPQYLVINGTVSPELVRWSGGDASAAVVAESASTGAAAKKHLGLPAYEPIIVEVGMPLSAALQNSLADLCANRPSVLTLVLIASDGTQYQAANAQLVEARFPALDAASAETYRLTLVFRPGSVQPVAGGSAVPTTPGSRASSRTSFRFALAGLPGSHVIRIHRHARSPGRWHR
jgi:hypothetical protein